LHPLDCEHHHQRSDGRAEHGALAQHDGSGHPWDNTVHEGVTEETHAPQHQPGTHGGGHESGEGTANEGSLLKSQGEGL
jgi:hypothetical protein